MANYYTQLARKEVSATFLMFVRSLIGGLCLLLFSTILGQIATTIEISASLWFLIINGVIILGLSKVLWIEAIHRIPITKALSLLFTIVPPLTLLFAYLILDEVPTWFQITGLVPIMAGMYFLIDKQKT